MVKIAYHRLCEDSHVDLQNRQIFSERISLKSEFKINKLNNLNSNDNQKYSICFMNWHNTYIHNHFINFTYVNLLDR